MTNCTDGSSTPECHDDKGIEHAADTLFPTFMTWARHPLGPWSEPVMVYSGVAETSDPPRASGDSNFAGVINDDGSVVGMWRGKGAGKACPKGAPAQHCGGSYQYTATAGPSCRHLSIPPRHHNAMSPMTNAPDMSPSVLYPILRYCVRNMRESPSTRILGNVGVLSNPPLSSRVAGHWKDEASYSWGAPSAARNVFPGLAAGGARPVLAAWAVLKIP